MIAFAEPGSRMPAADECLCFMPSSFVVTIMDWPDEECSYQHDVIVGRIGQIVEQGVAGTGVAR